MNLLSLLYRISAWHLVTSVVTSVVSGVAELGTTICVLESFRRGTVLWWQFALVAVFSLVIARYSRAAVGRLASQSIVRMRRRLVRSVLHLPLLELETIGATDAKVLRCYGHHGKDIRQIDHANQTRFANARLLAGFRRNNPAAGSFS